MDQRQINNLKRKKEKAENRVNKAILERMKLLQSDENFMQSIDQELAETKPKEFIDKVLNGKD